MVEYKIISAERIDPTEGYDYQKYEFEKVEK